MIRFLLSALCLLSACSREPTPSRAGIGAQAVPVTVAVAALTNVPFRLEAIGHVTAYSSVAVRSQVDGILESAHFQQGALVRQGDLIFTIDPRPFQAALAQAKANLKRDEALAKYVEFDAQRNSNLVSQGIVAQETNVQSQAAAEAAEATVAADRAAVDNARLQLSFCSIRSPINGRAGTLDVNPGNVVKSQDTVLTTLRQTEPIYVDFSVPEPELPEIRRRLASAGELPVAAHEPGGEQAPSHGKLIIVDNAVDTNTGSILLRAVFPNEDEQLWPGQFVHVELTVKTLRNVIVVPSEAVQVGQSGEYVFRVKPDSTVEARLVQAGSRVSGQTVILDGLQDGDTVVTTGQIRLAPGVRVRVEKPPPPRAAAVGGAPRFKSAAIRQAGGTRLRS
jgi:multidrug efflux system membrane fusion protein